MTTNFTPTATVELNSANVQFKGIGISGTATLLTTTNVDYKIPYDLCFSGGNLILNGQHFGDTVTLQVVDIDGIISPAGTVLGESLKDWNVTADSDYQHGAEVTYPVKILQNLYIRIRYTNIGLSNVSVRCNLRFHKILF